MVDVAKYSSEVQQPVRATVILDRHRHTRYAALFDREEGRASSLDPDGWTTHLGRILLATALAGGRRFGPVPDPAQKAEGALA
jgi:hypothetical protein